MKRTRIAFAFVGGAVLAVALMIALDGVDAHEGHPQKKLFDARWYQQLSNGDYGGWMTLSSSSGLVLNCDDPAACESRWIAPANGALSDWNNKSTTVDIVLSPGVDLDYDFNFVIEDMALDDPFLQGVALSFDSEYEVCFGCTIQHGWVMLGDAAHAGAFGTQNVRQSTAAHEMGHLFGLRHESVNGDESVRYECGMDDTGQIPDSIMSYDCINPVAAGGQGIFEVQPWDGCGVNHAYFDPTIGYAGCEGSVTPTPTPSGGPGGRTWGDVGCGGTVDPVDSLKVLRFDAGLQVTQPAGCPDMAEAVVVFGSPYDWGDVDCDGDVGPIDSLKVLREDAGLAVSQPFGCPEMGEIVDVS